MPQHLAVFYALFHHADLRLRAGNRIRRSGRHTRYPVGEMAAWILAQQMRGDTSRRVEMPKFHPAGVTEITGIQAYELFAVATGLFGAS